MSEYVPLAEEKARRQAAALGAFEITELHGQEAPERRWLVPSLVPRGAVTMLSGDGGVGKSLLAMQLMTAGGLAGRWIGIDVPRFTSLGYFCEDDRGELHRRQQAINRHCGCDFDALKGVRWWPRVGRENVLVQYGRDSHAPPRPSKGWSELERTVREHGVELIVIDTVADVFGGNENYRAEVRDFIGRLRDLARINDGAVLLMAHPSVAGQQSGTGLSGSTAWNNSVRSRLYFTRPRNLSDDESDARELRGMKSNYGKSGGKIRLRYERGVFVRDDSGTGMVAAIEQRNLMKRFVEFVAQMQARDTFISSSYCTAYAPTMMCDMQPNEKLSKQALRKVMFQALNDGLLRVQSERIDGRSRQRLVPADGQRT
jgi:RecA-family ATPase